MSVEHKHRKLCIKLYTDTCSHEKIFMRTHPCKSKKLRRGTSFHREHASQSFMWVKPMFSDMISYVESCLLRRVRKLSHLLEIWWQTWCHMLKVMHRHDFVSQKSVQTRCHMFNVTHRNEFVTQKVCRHPSFSVWKRLIVDTLRGNMSCSVRTRAWTCLVVETFVCKYCVRNKT